MSTETVITRIRVHPASPAASTSKALSILDSVCSAFFSFAAAKLYPARADKPDAFDPALLERTLAHVLSAYPHWSGVLRLSKSDDGGRAYQRRFGRVWVDFGSSTEPGVLLSFAERDELLASLIPPTAEGEPHDAAVLEHAGIYPDLASVVALRPEVTSAPAFAVRVVRFACGGVALGFRVSHTLADAGTLNRFVADWAEVHRTALAASGSLENVLLPDRPFAPEALDAYALGDLDANEPDEAVEAVYKALPRSAFDLWASPERHPPSMVRSSGPDSNNAELDTAAGSPRGTPAPWETWDLAAPVSLKTLFLASGTLARIWAAAGGREGGVSAHDALVGHFWRLVVRARGLPVGREVRITPAVGVRMRLDPPLKSEALGSNFVLLASSATSDALAREGGEAVAARAIRSTIAAATPATLGALLHHEAHQLDPIRVQPYFCGEEHTSMSSWIGAGAYEADFGAGPPAYAEGVLPAVDGMLLFEDVTGTAKKWVDRGARVKLALRDEVMRAVLADPELLSPEAGIVRSA
ncbi:hypothetical protein JCM10450v2_004114 [Rhodotorula kratochvilovae]